MSHGSKNVHECEIYFRSGNGRGINFDCTQLIIHLFLSSYFLFILISWVSELAVSGKDVPVKKAKKKWTPKEKAAVYRHLRKFLVTKQLPGKEAIQKCLDAEPSLSHRNWRNIKDFCRNTMSKGSKALD